MIPRGSTEAPWLEHPSETEGPPGFTVYALHSPSADHLAEVKAEMQKLGPPELEAVYFNGHIMALEGSHRLAAASALGLVPRFLFHSPHDVLVLPRYDWFDPELWDEWKLPAGIVVLDIFRTEMAIAYRFPGHPQMRVAGLETRASYPGVAGGQVHGSS